MQHCSCRVTHSQMNVVVAALLPVQEESERSFARESAREAEGARERLQASFASLQHQAAEAQKQVAALRQQVALLQKQGREMLSGLQCAACAAARCISAIAAAAGPARGSQAPQVRLFVDGHPWGLKACDRGHDP